MEKWREEKQQLFELCRKAHRIAYRARKIGNKDIEMRAERLARNIIVTSRRYPVDFRGGFSLFIKNLKEGRKKVIQNAKKARVV